MDSFLTQLREQVSRPVEAARGLPNACYTDPAFFRHEQQRLFARHWTAVAVGAEIPNPGDMKPVTLAGLPILLVRGRDGEIRGFHNVCSHRGMTLVTEPCHGQPAIRCPYHSWAYALDGALKATPFVGGPQQNNHPDFSKADKGLKPVRVGVFWDIVFAVLSGEAPPIETWMKPVSDRWSYYDAGAMTRGNPADSVGQFTLQANWKLAMENFCEAYHLPWIHPGLNSYSRLEDHYHIFGETFAGQGSRKYAPVESGNGTFPQLPGLPPDAVSGAEYLAVFPNLWLGAQCDHFYVVILDPAAPDRVVETMHLYYLGEAAAAGADFAALREKNRRLWSQVFLEDVGVVEGMQRGRASPAFDGGCFSPVMDTPTLHFHRLVAAAL